MNSKSTYISRLKSRLRNLQERFTKILQSSRLEQYIPQSNPLISVISDTPKAPQIKVRWDKLSPELEREQNQILKDFQGWNSDFMGLFLNATQDENSDLQVLYFEMDSWIRYRQYRGVPDSSNTAIALFNKTCEKFINIGIT